MYYFKYLPSTVRHFWCFRGFGRLIQLVRVIKQSGHRVEFRISKHKSRKYWVGTGFQQGASACKMNASTRIQFPANNSSSFDLKVQWKRCLPWIPYPPQVDLMYFFLDVVCTFNCDPQRIIMSRPITSCGCCHKLLIHTLQFIRVSRFSSLRVWPWPVFSVSFSLLFLFLSPLAVCLTFIHDFIWRKFCFKVYMTRWCVCFLFVSLVWYVK